LTRKDQKLELGPSQKEAFEGLKDKLCTTPVLAYPNFELPFILTTDASKLAVAAVLSQVQDGLERPIVYASRQLNRAEEAYSASESEMLALVWATNVFRCYLHGKKFLVRTDHSALSYLRKFSDHNSRLMRWSLKLSELDFVVEHRPGSKIGHVVALSRHVGAVLHEDSLDKERILSEQQKEELCTTQEPGTYSSKREFFLDKDGVIYRRRPCDKHQIVVPRSLNYDVIQESHNPVYVAHPGVKRTHDLILLQYWWPGMRRSIVDYIRKYDHCQRRKEDREYIAPLGDVEQPMAPFQISAMDVTGPCILTPRKNKYLLTFIDHFTRYAEAFPIPDQTAETCDRIYATQIITRHGTGSKLITDQGRAFMSTFFSETFNILGVHKIHTTSYHPLPNGILELWHRSLHTGLSHYINASHTNWDVVVPFYVMAYRATPNTVTNFSPFYLLHGREMPLPNSDNLKARVSREKPDNHQRLENLKASLNAAYKYVNKSNKKAQENNKRLYDRRAKLRKFKVGDLVYLYSPAMKSGLSRKFNKPWSGPHKITRVVTHLNYEIVDQNNEKQTVHVNKLKLAYDSEAWKHKSERKTVKKARKKPNLLSAEEEKNETKFGPHPLLEASQPTEHKVPLDQTPITPEAVPQITDTPTSESQDPTYLPPQTPRSRR